MKKDIFKKYAEEIRRTYIVFKQYKGKKELQLKLK